MTFIPDSHKSVNNIHQIMIKPEIGDIVTAFDNKEGVIVNHFEGPKGGPFEVINIKTRRSMMVFAHEMKVIAKPWMKVMAIEANMQSAMIKAQQIAIEFDAIVNA